MPNAITISLPIGDRRVSCDFYSEGLGLGTVGEPDEDGMPEPLRFELNASTRLMLVPRGGFQWVIDPVRIAPQGTSECLLSLAFDSETQVEALFRQAVAAGASALSEPKRQEWGYEAIIKDPDGHLWSIIAA